MKIMFDNPVHVPRILFININNNKHTQYVQPGLRSFICRVSGGVINMRNLAVQIELNHLVNGSEL